MDDQSHPQTQRRSGGPEGGLSSNDLARVIEALTGERLPPTAPDGTFGRTTL